MITSITSELEPYKDWSDLFWIVKPSLWSCITSISTLTMILLTVQHLCMWNKAHRLSRFNHRPVIRIKMRITCALFFLLKPMDRILWTQVPKGICEMQLNQEKNLTCMNYLQWHLKDAASAFRSNLMLSSYCPTFSTVLNFSFMEV